MSAIKKLGSKASRFNISDNDGGGGEILGRISGADTPASQLSTEWISLESLRVDEKNPRRLFLSEKRLMMDPTSSDNEQERAMLQDLRALADSIREDGLANPIEVYPLPGDGYRIISGERRYWASLYNLRSCPPDQRFRFENVRVTVYREPPKRIRRKQLTENVLRSKLALPDLLHSIRAAYEESEQLGTKIQTAKEFSKALDLPYHEALVWFAVLKRWPGLQAIISNGLIDSVHHVRQVLALNEDQIARVIPKISQYGFSPEVLAEAGAALPPPPAKPKVGRPKAVFFAKAKITPSGAQKLYEALAERFELGAVDWSDLKASRKAFDALIKALNA